MDTAPDLLQTWIDGADKDDQAATWDAIKHVCAPGFEKGEVMDAKELNAKIAERIMGWVLNKFEFWDGTPWDNHIAPDGIPSTGYWNPCEDWAHFGLLLQRIVNNGGFAGVSWLGTEACAMVAGRTYFHRFAEDDDEHRLHAACAAILEAWESGR